MKFRVEDERAEAKLRPIAINIAMWGLRMSEDYRRAFGNDLDMVAILLAVAATTMRRFAAVDLDSEYDDLRMSLPDEELAPCNITSIAEATGLPRETARRKTHQLIGKGILRWTATGTIAFETGLGQQNAFYEAVRRQAGEVARLATLFSQAGIIQPIANDAAESR